MPGSTLIQSRKQRLRGPEPSNALGLGHQRLTRLRIPKIAAVSLADEERAKPSNLHATAIRQLSRNRREEYINDPHDMRPIQVAILMLQSLNQFRTDHGTPPRRPITQICGARKCPTLRHATDR